MGAVAVSNLLFSCGEGSGNGLHGLLRILTLDSAVRKSRRRALLEAVCGSHSAVYAVSHDLELSVTYPTSNGDLAYMGCCSPLKHRVRSNIVGSGVEMGAMVARQCAIRKVYRGAMQTGGRRGGGRRVCLRTKELVLVEARGPKFTRSVAFAPQLWRCTA